MWHSKQVVIKCFQNKKALSLYRRGNSNIKPVSVSHEQKSARLREQGLALREGDAVQLLTEKNVELWCLQQALDYLDGKKGVLVYVEAVPGDPELPGKVQRPGRRRMEYCRYVRSTTEIAVFFASLRQSDPPRTVSYVDVSNPHLQKALKKDRVGKVILTHVPQGLPGVD